MSDKQQELATVHDLIPAAVPVHGVPRKDELIVHACDECFALHDAFPGRRWTDIPVRQIHEHYSELPFFSPVAHHYYLPAFVRPRPIPRGGMIFRYSIW